MTHRDEPLALVRDELSTPVGPFTILVDERGALHAAGWNDTSDRLAQRLDVPARRAVDPHGISAAFDAFFSGDAHALDDVAISAHGTTFQRRVWSALRAIPYGTTISYGELARRIGNPRAVRAVGLANGANPTWVIVPCHRVIGADGTLTGYGGGIERKRWLLELEAARRV